MQNASLAAMGRDEIFQYEMNLKAYRDLKNVVDTAFVEGEDVGFAKGMSSVAKSMKQAGEPLEKIIQYTGLTEDQIRKF